MDQLNTYLYIAAVLFSIGIFGVMTRRNGIAVLMGVELILNAANINFIAFSKYGGMNFDGHVFALFIIVLAAAEAAVALAIANVFFPHSLFNLLYVCVHACIIFRNCLIYMHGCAFVCACGASVAVFSSGSKAQFVRSFQFQRMRP